MSSLHKLVVENFQSHERSEVTFGAGLNVIVGPSDFGKSALVRALRWLFYNEPRGADFIRAGARSCRVTVELDDGTKIARLRSATKNQYILTRPGEGELVYEGFGNEIPLEIEQASEIRKVLVDERNKVELNFGAQLDGPFLLTENGAVRAKVIGQLGGVHILDWAQKSTGTDLRRLREEEGQLTTGLGRLAAELERYAHLPALETAVAKLDETVACIESIATTVAALEELQRQWQDVSSALAQAGRLLAALGPLAQAEQWAHELEAAAVDHSNLSAIASELSLVSQQLEKTKGRLVSLARLDEAEQRLDGVSNLLGNCVRLAQLDKEISRTAGQLAQAEQTSALTASVSTAEALWQRAEELSRQWSELRRTAGELSAVMLSLEGVDRTAALTAPVAAAEALWQQAEELCRQWSELSRTAAELSSVAGSLEGVDRIAARTGLLERADSCLTNAVAAWQSLHVLQELGQDWEDEDRKYQGAALAADRYRQEMERLLSDYRRLLTRLGRCPVCFGELTPEAVEQALSEYQ